MRALALILTLVLALPALAKDRNSTLVDSYEALHAPKTNFSGISVTNVIFRKDVAEFFLSEGTIFFMQSVEVAGRSQITGAVFVGSGRFIFKPRPEVEQGMLRKFYGSESLDLSFDFLFLRFTHQTFLELEQKIGKSGGIDGKEFEKEISECTRYWNSHLNDDATFALVRSTMMRSGDGFLYAQVGRDKPVFFVYDPHDLEEVRLQNSVSWSTLLTKHHHRQTICQFDRMNKGPGNARPGDTAAEIKPLHYTIDASVESNGMFTASVKAEFEVLADTVHVLRYFLTPAAKVTMLQNDRGSLPGAQRSAIIDDGTDLQNGLSQVIIFFENPLTRGEIRQVTFEYSGSLLLKDLGLFYIKSAGLWFPRFDFFSRTSFDMTFRTPEKYVFLASGKQIEDRIEGEQRITRWIRLDPVEYAGFNMGPFKSYEVPVGEFPGLPAITLYSTGGGEEDEVAADIANSIHYFNTTFGPFPYDALAATEVPFRHGISFPGLLHLSRGTYKRTSLSGYSESFRAHEVAHQWFGNSISGKTYHDAWLSEGFAEYAGMMYVQWVLKDNDIFFDMLERMRKNIFSNRKYLFSDGEEAGPIYLGHRTETYETWGDYSLIIYEKGAYVLHMLRNLFLDLKTMRDDRFLAMMQDYYKTYRGRSASTEDFQAIVEKHAGIEMDWFFRQWIYGTEVPTYEFSYDVEETENGSYKVECEVRQKDVSEGFRMYVPLSVDYGHNQFSHFRFLIDQASMRFTLPLLPQKPKKVMFNAFDSVLAKVKNK